MASKRTESTQVTHDNKFAAGLAALGSLHSAVVMALVEAPVSGGFGLNNLPWGVFRRCGSTSDAAGRPAIGVALGQHVVDVSALQQAGLLSGPILSKAGACLQKVRVHCTSLAPAYSRQGVPVPLDCIDTQVATLTCTSTFFQYLQYVNPALAFSPFPHTTL